VGKVARKRFTIHLLSNRSACFGWACMMKCFPALNSKSVVELIFYQFQRLVKYTYELFE